MTIEDDGPGLTQDRRANVFDPFWHAAQSPREGTGLGIAITKGIVEAHGGTLSLSSATGRGTAWAIALPRKPGG